MIIEAITGLISGFVDFFQQGGIITYIITFIGIWGFITSLQKVNYLRRISDIDATEIMGVVSVAMERGGAIEALKEISPYKNPVTRIISEALKIGYKNKTEVEESMEQIFIVETSKMT